MNLLNDFLSREFLENPLRNYLWFSAILVTGLLLKRVLSVLLSRFLFRFINSDQVAVSECIALLRKPVEFLITLLIIYLAFHYLVFPPSWQFATIDEFGIRLILARTFQCILIGAISWIIIRVIKFFALIFLRKAELTESKLDDQFVPFFRDLAIVFVVVATGFVMLGRVFNIDVVALITGLGIGGLAIALAAKETLENLFASFTIFLDLPFTVGDGVQIDKISGEIEKIGFRSTRIRTLEGSLVTIPNRLLTSQALDNLSKRDYRRARYLLKLRLDTPVDSLKKVIADIQQIIDADELTNQKQGGVRFEGFSENSVDVLVIYYIQTQDYWKSQQIKENINFEIMKILEKNEVQFASPLIAVHTKE
ncbi:MscS family membrane protein [Pseudarcicella hirudinis]|uniref:MscS family membrane protein n=1 Tax=Pseudarcicella hirudinis TaxID=1079859 RepID=A0A1I5VXV1_9BACT|nr:mechanosensitive ion channel family protein [Pseudarcicella hirudinis]SFQ12147.1 MscS family membrane protein [Pseudarcicella hirudinis]